MSLVKPKHANKNSKIQTFNELYVLIIKFANHICTTKQTNYVKTCQILSYHVVSGHNRQKIAQLTLHCWLEEVIKEFSGFKACFFLTDITYFLSFSGPQLYNSEALIFISMLLQSQLINSIILLLCFLCFAESMSFTQRASTKICDWANISNQVKFKNYIGDQAVLWPK